MLDFSVVYTKLFYPHFYHQLLTLLRNILFHSSIVLILKICHLCTLHGVSQRATFIYKLTRYCWSGLSPFSSVTNFPIRLCSSAKSSGSSFIKEKKKQNEGFVNFKYDHNKKTSLAGVDPGFSLGGGAPLRNDITDW